MHKNIKGEYFKTIAQCNGASLGLTYLQSGFPGDLLAQYEDHLAKVTNKARSCLRLGGTYQLISNKMSYDSIL